MRQAAADHKNIRMIQKRKRHYAGTIELRERQEERPEITGMAIVFGRESEPLYADDTLEIREVIAPEAVTRELLDGSTILMTLYHDNGRLLARSLRGEGSLKYEVTGEGVRFRFIPPDTEDGRVAEEAIRRGDITGCSFAFSVDYSDRACVERSSETRDGREYVLYTVKRMNAIHDFTLTPIPAYPDTECASALRDMERACPETHTGAHAVARRQEMERLRAIASCDDTGAGDLCDI